MSKQITINSLDLGYTVDTYGMFNGESVEEGEAEYINDQYDLTEDEWRGLGWNYDHKAIVTDLAKSSIQLLHENLVQHGDGVVTDINFISSTSPQFYNYTTDSYKADWTVDVDKLLEFLNKDTAAFANHLVESWNEFVNVPSKLDLEWLTDDDDKMLVVGLDFYTRSQYDIEDYEMSMFEHESEAYTENMTLDTESQKLIDSKEQKNA